jgi:hypothetical protein
MYNTFIVESRNIGIDDQTLSCKSSHKELLNQIHKNSNKIITFYQELMNDENKYLMYEDGNENNSIRGIYEDSISIQINRNNKSVSVLNQKYGCGLAWSKHFNLKSTVTPKYFLSYLNKKYDKTFTTNDINEQIIYRLGIRSTKWAILEDNDSKDIYACISVHLPVGGGIRNNIPPRRRIIIRSILEDIQELKKTYNCKIIIGGDFNTPGKSIYKLFTDGNGKQYLESNKVHFTATEIELDESLSAIKIETGFRERIDYFILDNELNHSKESIIGIKGQTKNNLVGKRKRGLTNEYKQKGYDHAALRLVIIPDLHPFVKQ